MRPKLKSLPKAKSAQGTLVVKLQAQLQQAVVLHQHGRLKEASQIYEGLLQVDPKHFDALHMLGVIAYQTKNYEIAVDLIGKVISINSNNSVGKLKEKLRQQRLNAPLFEMERFMRNLEQAFV